MPTIQGKSQSFLALKGRKKWRKIQPFPAKRFFFTVFLDIKKEMFWQLCFNLASEIRFFFAQSASFLVKLIIFSKKLFPSKCSFGHWECSFDTPVVLSFAAVKFSSVQTSKKGQKCTHFSRITSIIFPRSVFWTRELHFWQRRRKQVAKLRTFFHSEFQTDRKKLLFQ